MVQTWVTRVDGRRSAWRGAALLAALALGALAGCAKAPEPPKATPPVPITVATAEKKVAPVEYRTFGTVQANLTAAIKSQITGNLDRIHFKEGEDVKEGQTLFSIDTKPLEAALAQAQANVSRDEAMHRNAVKEEQRQQELLKKGVVAQDIYDTARTSVESLAAVIQAGHAAIDSAQVQLSYCTIKSPIDGRMGQWLVHQGNLVKANDMTLAVVNQVKPIQVTFAVPQRLLQMIKEEMPKHKLRVRALLAGQEDRPFAGELTFVDNTVDPATLTICLKATFANDDGRLWPGAYVDVILTLKEEPDRIVVPTRAIQTGQKGQYVFVVKPDKTAEMRPVTVERALDGDSVIAKGLDEGETVVMDGQLRLVTGSKTVLKPGADESKPKASAEAGGKTPDDTTSGPKSEGPKVPAEKSEGRRP